MAKDIMLDDDYDLAEKNGDFVIDDSEVQEAALIVHSEPGEWRQYPTVGMGIMKYLKGVENRVKFERDLRVALEADGKKPSKIDTSKGIKNFTVEL